MHLRLVEPEARTVPRLYLASFATQTDWECFQEDGDDYYDSIHALASPSGFLVRSFEEARQRFVKEMDESMTRDEQRETVGFVYDELVWCGNEESNLVWETTHNGKIVAVIILREEALPR